MTLWQNIGTPYNKFWSHPSVLPFLSYIIIFCTFLGGVSCTRFDNKTIKALSVPISNGGGRKWLHDTTWARINGIMPLLLASWVMKKAFILKYDGNCNTAINTTKHPCNKWQHTPTQNYTDLHNGGVLKRDFWQF